MKQFTFYRNYYELIKHLKNTDRLSLYDAIFNYMFEDIEPTFNDLKEGIWINLKMPLDTSKNNSGRGGAPKDNQNAKKITTEKQPKNNRLKTEKKTNKNISIFLFLISNFNFLLDRGLLRGKIEEWLEYKEERKEYYKETGLKTLLARIESATSQYGEEKVINLIDECMASNYKGIIFEKLDKLNKPTQRVQRNPEWFDKDLHNEKMTKEEEKELDDILSSIETTIGG